MTGFRQTRFATVGPGLPGIWRGFTTAALCAAGLALAGCGSGTTTVSTPTPVPPAPYSGPGFNVTVMVGTTRVVGATVQFYAAGTTGNGSAATALNAAVTTDSTGSVKVPATYTCPTSGAMVYLKASGGSYAGVAAGSGNVLVTAVGACSSVMDGSAFVLNEATTVAAGYSLQAFYANGNIGATATNLTGLTNAFATAGTLANPATGSTASTLLPANGVSPADRVNSLANALNACILNSANCAALYASAPNGSPADTFEAVVDLARYPAKNVLPIYAESLLSTVYSPRLVLSPLDWTLFVNYSGGGLNSTSMTKSSPSTLALDSAGNVWVATYFGVAVKYSPIGAPVFPGGVTGFGLNNSYGAAVDLSDNAWIANEQPYTQFGIGTVSVLTPSGAALSGTGFSTGGLNYPISIAIDPNGTAWVVDYGNSHVTLLNKAGAPLSGPTGYTTPLFAFPVVVALDGNHFGWIGNQADTTVTKVAPDGSAFTNYSCCNGASGIAIDASNNVWVANFYGDSVSMINAAGQVVANQAYKGGGQVNHPQGIAIDGAGTVFVANYRASYLTELAGATATVPGAALSPAVGLGGDAQLLEPFAVAVDASGNVWVSNQGNDTVTKYVGLAVPVKTPLSGLTKAP